jgi:hypothetical protein
MRVFTCNEFRGHWPVGTAAVIVAHDGETAWQLLAQEIASQGLPPLRSDDKIEEIDMTTAGVRILNDGNY